MLLPAIQQTAKLTTAARAVGMPVVFTNDAHLPGIDRELALWGAHGIAGTPEAQTSPLLDPQPTDYVVEKRRYSGFFQTGLLLLLNELDVDTLICCGMDTKYLREAHGGRRLFQQLQHHRGGRRHGHLPRGQPGGGPRIHEGVLRAKVVDTNEAVNLIEG